MKQPLIIGERLNSSRKAIGQAVRDGDSSVIEREAQQQVAAGAHYLDLNVGTFLEDEVDKMLWLLQTVRSCVEVPFCIDSPNPKVIERACSELDSADTLINSLTLETHRWQVMLPLLKNRQEKFVALCLDDQGMPQNAEQRVAVARKFIKALSDEGIWSERFFLDPLVVPLSTDAEAGKKFLDALRTLKAEWPQVKTICGLSNISFGLPHRRVLNQNFLTLVLREGIDAVILDPTDQQLRCDLIATHLLLGHDPYCMNYLQAASQNLFTPQND